MGVEVFAEIAGYENEYAVTSNGRVYSYKSGKFLSPAIGTGGYLHVVLSKNSKLATVNIHRLVAEAFVENPDPDNFTIVNHKDENKLNNVSSNLEWCDYRYNLTYRGAIERNLQVKRKHGRPNGGRRVVQYNIKMEKINEFDSISDAERFVGGDLDKVLRRKKKRKEAFGYLWEFAN